jgi:hypothetical protein
VALIRVPAVVRDAAYSEAAMLETTEPKAAPRIVPVTPKKEAANAVVTAASAPPAIFVALRSRSGVLAWVVSVVVLVEVGVVGLSGEGFMRSGLDSERARLGRHLYTRGSGR